VEDEAEGLCAPTPLRLCLGFDQVIEHVLPVRIRGLPKRPHFARTSERQAKMTG
jgi:hypothetical protein